MTKKQHEPVLQEGDLESRLRAAESKKRALPAAPSDMQLAVLLAETLVEILRRRRG